MRSGNESVSVNVDRNDHNGSRRRGEGWSYPLSGKGVSVEITRATIELK